MKSDEIFRLTAKLDGWEGDPYDPERWQTYYQCNSCGEFTLIQGSIETHGHYPDSARCKCGSKNWNPQSAISKRTFNMERAKAKTSAVKKLNEKRFQASL